MITRGYLIRSAPYRLSRRTTLHLAGLVLARLPAAAVAHSRRRKRRRRFVRQFCGGIAGLPCPAGLVCVDDPTDSCDPMHGGADCGGICVPEPCAERSAAEGSHAR